MCTEKQGKSVSGRRLRINTHIRTYTSTHTYTYSPKHTHKYTHTNKYTHIHKHTNIHTHTHTHAHTRTHTHIHTYTHTFYLPRCQKAQRRLIHPSHAHTLSCTFIEFSGRRLIEDCELSYFQPTKDEGNDVQKPVLPILCVCVCVCLFVCVCECVCIYVCICVGVRECKCL